MAAYAAAVSIENTIEHILESSRFSLVPPSPEILRQAHSQLYPLKEILRRLDSRSKGKSRKKVNGLDEEMKEALWRFEDLLEHHLSQQILSQSGDARSLFSIDLRILQHDVDSFIETMEDLERKYSYELDNMPQVEDDEWVSSRNDLDGMKMLPLFSDLYADAKRSLTNRGGQRALYLCGMAGSGKTSLAKRLFDDAIEFFDHRVWVTVGRKSESGAIARRILAEVDDKTTQQGDEEDIGERLKERMKGKGCLIVLDDVWDDIELLRSFWNYFPNDGDALIRILLTTKISNYNNLKFISTEPTMTMRPLSAQESEDLLREKVFGEGDFPSHLKEAATKIAKNCRGLPLMIAMVADVLSNSTNTDAQYWDDVAEKRNSVLRDASYEIAKVLFPVYDCFPQHLKMFFLYLGAFPEDSEIFSYKLIHLLDVEGFIGKYDLRYNFSPSLRYFGSENNITVNAKISNYAGHILKSFSTNPFWRLLFNIVASKDKFLHVVDSSFDPSDGNLKGQRRLCMHSNFLFNFKQVVESVRHDCAFHARSLLCFGPYHQYPMPLDVGFKLLRLLDALKVHFYIFPIEILNLVQLQYLALSYNGKLPTSISKFINLHFLIIHPRVSIRSCGAPSYVPVQIWDMQELKYVDIFGSNLPNPIFDSTLEKLSTLLGVSPNSCTREVLGKIPNIMKLGVQIELIPQDDQDCDQMNCTFLPDNLDTFKYSILNPAVKNGFIVPLTPLSMLPQTLRKLHLSGLGYPWKYMKIIGSLPILEVLKLRCYAFRGPKWESERESFLHLKLLVIEDSDLVWILLRSGFPKLMHLSLKHCYKLQDLHWPDYGLYTRTIELFNCSPSAVTSAKQLKQERQDHIGLNVFSDDEELQQIYHKILSPSK